MRLLTHNLLMCNRKGCSTNNFPLRINATNVTSESTDFNPDLIRNVLPKLDWAALSQTVGELSLPGLPEACPAADDDTSLQQLHQLIIDTHVKEGELICNGCGRSYPIKNGIPNMLLNEDEL
eukprot:GILI01011465.1.p1 GENE.GILI01011465.1~~GILI01011465.1.p1  ORF type:complete len:122 (-),score=37.17 GILI01011465.1:55-420(-)